MVYHPLTLDQVIDQIIDHAIDHVVYRAVGHGFESVFDQ